MRSAVSKVTTTLGVAPSHPRAVERGDAEIRRHGQVPSTLDEIAEPVIIASLPPRPSRHADDHRSFCSRASPQGREGRRCATTRARKCIMSVQTARLHLALRFITAAQMPPEAERGVGGNLLVLDRLRQDGAEMTTGYCRRDIADVLRGGRGAGEHIIVAATDVDQTGRNVSRRLCQRQIAASARA